VAAGKQVRSSLLLREVNELINDPSDTWRDGEKREFLCECGTGECTEKISVTRADYQAARGQPGRFLAVAGHLDTGLSSVLGARNGYLAFEYPDDPTDSGG
jgi:hypothetical protein